MSIAKVVVFLTDSHRGREIALYIRHFLRLQPLSAPPQVESRDTAEAFLQAADKHDSVLYILQIDQAQLADPGFAVACYLRRRSPVCPIAVIVPELTVLRQVTEAMLSPGYIFTPVITEAALEQYLRRALSLFNGDGSTISLSVHGQSIRLETETVICCTVQDNQVLLTTSRGSYSLRLTLAALEQRLPASFVRVNRGALINLRYLERVDKENNLALLQGGLSVSLSHRGACRLEDMVLRQQDSL